MVINLYRFFYYTANYYCYCNPILIIISYCQNSKFQTFFCSRVSTVPMGSGGDSSGKKYSGGVAIMTS